MVDINKVVTVDIKVEKDTEPIGSYNKVLYITNTAPDLSAAEIADGKVCKEYSSYSEIEALGTSTTALKQLAANANIFFSNSGKVLLVAKPTTYTVADVMTLISNINAKHNFIYVVWDMTNTFVTEEGVDNSVVGLAAAFDALVAPYTKRLCLTTNSKTYLAAEGVNGNLISYPVFVKYCTKTYDSSITTTPSLTLYNAAMSFAAFTTLIDLNGYNTIRDYCYEKEVSPAAETVTMKEYDNLIKNYNYNDTIGGVLMNFGGNLTNKTSIDIDFGVVCIENEISSEVLDIMTNRIRINPSGQATIVSAINSVLARYVDNGLIQTGEVFSAADITYSYNAKTYIVIKQGTTLLNGYYVFTVPTSAISALDKADKNFTPTMAIIMTAVGARTINITGKAR